MNNSCIDVVISPKENKACENEINTGTVDWDKKAKSTDFDWGDPVSDLTTRTDDLDLKWSDDEKDSDEEDSDGGIKLKLEAEDEKKAADTAADEGEAAAEQIDIMAQQLKFVACLKILMEELSTLATGFEVDGGQLRYHLYVWLEKEVDALRQLCNYTTNYTHEPADLELSMDAEVGETNPSPTLHEILIQEKLDFEAKVQRAAKRKRWLRGNVNYVNVEC